MYSVQNVQGFSCLCFFYKSVLFWQQPHFVAELLTDVKYKVYNLLKLYVNFAWEQRFFGILLIVSILTICGFNKTVQYATPLTKQLIYWKRNSREEFSLDIRMHCGRQDHQHLDYFLCGVISCLESISILICT